MPQYNLWPPCFKPSADCVVPSVNDVAKDNPIAAPSVNLNFVPIKSGVIV